MAETTEQYRTRINQIKTNIEQEPEIRKMRDDIAEGVSKTGNRQADIEVRQNTLEDDFVAVQQDASSASPSGAEVAVARGSYPTLDERLTKKEQEVTAQFAQNIKKWQQLFVNVKDFGAKGDGITDDTVAIQAAVDSLGLQGGTIYFPDGIYLYKGTVLLSNKIRLVGYGRKRVIHRNYDDTNVYNVDEPIFAAANYKTALTNEDIYLSSMSFFTKGERTAYSVELTNTITPDVTDCDFAEVGNSSVNSMHGLGIRRAGGYVGSFYLAKVKDSRFSRSVLHVEATDSYILDNELWGNERSRALFLYNAGNTFVRGNQIVGGSVYGGIHLGANAIGMKITDNYFDGSYYELDTAWGIYSDSNVFEKSIIANNNFWHQKGGGISAKNLSNSQIVNNVFDECDYYGKGQADIELGQGTTGDGVFSNNIANSHYRNKKINVARDGLVDRDTVNPTPVMRIKNMTAVVSTTTINSLMSWEQFYGTAEYTGSVVVQGGNNLGKFTPVGYDNSYPKVHGTGYIPPGQSAVFITHNLGYNPRGSDIHITIMSPLFNAKSLFIQNGTTTGITVKADMLVPGELLSGEVSFSWEVVKQR